MMSTTTSATTMLVPDFPFSYDRWLCHPAGLGAVPSAVHGTEVAVVGGGMSGLTAAYELLRLGLRPVLYEAEQLGGRMRSIPFPGNPEYKAEMGAMRFPVSARSLFHYIDLLGLHTRPFPNPLAPVTPSTLIDLNGGRDRARTPDELPDIYQEVADAWTKALQERADLDMVHDAIQRRDVTLLKTLWNRLVREFDDQSFYGFLATSPTSSRSVTGRSSARSGSATAAGTPTSPTRCWRSCVSSPPGLTTTRSASSAARPRSRAGCGSTGRWHSRTGRTAPRWRHCTAAGPGPRSPGCGVRRTAYG
jgi:phytoene dehydrogenase-like protein